MSCRWGDKDKVLWARRRLTGAIVRLRWHIVGFRFFCQAHLQFLVSLLPVSGQARHSRFWLCSGFLGALLVRRCAFGVRSFSSRDLDAEMHE